MIFDFECGIPVGDILAIMYYVRRTYFKDKDIIHDKEYHHFIEDLVKEKGVPQPAAGVLIQELICTPQNCDLEQFIDSTSYKEI